MKATDLMLGDWVYNTHNRQNEQVAEIVSGLVMLAYNDLYEYDEIEPIPLTPEILEKNGWECEYFGKRQEWWLDKTKFPIVRYSTNDTLHHNGIVLKYVHELQHALKLCRVEKEIEL